MLAVSATHTCSPGQSGAHHGKADMKTESAGGILIWPPGDAMSFSSVHTCGLYGGRPASPQCTGVDSMEGGQPESAQDPFSCLLSSDSNRLRPVLVTQTGPGLSQCCHGASCVAYARERNPPHPPRGWAHSPSSLL